MFNVDTILAQANLRELVAKAGGEIGSDGRCACPIHGGNDTSAFSVYVKDGRELWHCFSGSCGGGDAISFVQAWQKLDFKQACLFLGGDIASDPVAMEESARRRHDEAQRKHEETRLQVEARRKELQVAEIHLHYHNTMSEWARLEWARRGLDESWQNFYSLGGCDDKVINYKGNLYHTPSLTIPIFGEDWGVLNIKHRLMNPPTPKDKYRPEKEGLGPFPPMLGMPPQGYDGSAIWVMEGEIKAMVCCAVADHQDWQFIGVPGQSQFKSVADKIRGKNIIVVPDPGAEKEAWEFCKSVNGRFLNLGHKIDDYVIGNGFDGDMFRAWEKQARKGY